jgi:quercetin dioxygenase-like cupin family protein
MARGFSAGEDNDGGKDMTLAAAFPLAASATPSGFEPHPVFQGVRMKLAVMGAQTHGSFSSHLVQVDPGCSLASHRHLEQDEQHVVLGGSGELTLGGERRGYAPGDVAVIPQGYDHAVVAGRDGILLLATFSPPLK